MENMSHPILAARELNILRLAAEGDSRGQSERAEDIASGRYYGLVGPGKPVWTVPGSIAPSNWRFHV